MKNDSNIDLVYIKKIDTDKVESMVSLIIF